MQTTGTIKHFCANNQEQARTRVEAVVSQRALREIYLKVFEMAVKEGKARSIMTSYGPINGIWAAGNFDLCTTILRKQWNYQGIVMTDWWGCANWEGELAYKENRAPMVLAQNDIYMCCADAEEEVKLDNVAEMLDAGKVSLAELQRNAKNILGFLLQSPVMLRMAGKIEDELSDMQDEETNVEQVHVFAFGENESITVTGDDLTLDAEEIVFGIEISESGEYLISVEASSELNNLAQLPVSIYLDNIYLQMFTFRGMEGGVDTQECSLGNMIGKNHFIKLKCVAKGLEILGISVKKVN